MLIEGYLYTLPFLSVIAIYRFGKNKISDYYFNFLFSVSLFAVGKSPVFDQVSEATRQFYCMYLSHFDGPVKPIAEKDMEKFLSISLLKKIDQIQRKNMLKANYFTKSQDSISDWQDNIDVRTTEIVGDEEATVVVEFGKGSSKNSVAVQLKKERWRIFAVLALESAHVSTWDQQLLREHKTVWGKRFLCSSILRLLPKKSVFSGNTNFFPDQQNVDFT